MPSPNPLPNRQVQRPILLTDAVRSGISMAELSGPLWRAPSYGVRVWHGLTDDDPVVRIQVVAASLPSDAVISGWAAAHVLGVPWLDGRDPAVSDDALLDVLVLRNRDHPPLRRRGLRTLRSAVDVDDIVVADGIRVSSPVRTVFELLRSPPLVEAVASVDAMLNAGLVSIEQLAAYVRARPRWRGTPFARRALGLVDGGAESPMESRLRLIWVRGGLPRPLVNVPVYDRHTGYLLGRPDLLDEEAGVVVEYDGAYHRSPDQHRADNSREHRLEQAGLIVIRFDNHDTVRTQAKTLAVMKEARARGLRRDRRHDSWSRSNVPWWFDMDGP
jgi:Protein of unknown function (DUF559)